MIGISAIVAAGSAVIALRSQFSLPAVVDWRGGAKASPTGNFMNAISYTEHGGPDVLSFQKVPRPIPRDGQILIHVKASSVNPIDFKLRRNPVPDWILRKPKIPGADLAGIVVQVGTTTEVVTKKNDHNTKKNSFKIGDRVAAMMPLIGGQWGSNAEYVAIDSSLVASLPDAVEYESAAALPLVSLTVMQSLNKLKSTTKGKKILIHAGAGGVGTFAIQYAKYVLGMYVATTASKEKAEFLKSLGADLVIDYRTQDFTTIVKDYDAVLDTMSFLYEAKTLRTNVLKKTGHYLNIFSSDWSLVNGKEKSFGLVTCWNVVLHKLVNLLAPGRFLPKYDFCVVNPNGSQLQLALDLLGNGKIQSVIDSVYPLSKLSDAHEHLEGGHVTGKVVIQHEENSSQ